MKTVLILLIFFVGIASARESTDSLKAKPFKFPKNWFQEQLPQINPFGARIEHDGVVIGNTKYFIMMVRPDPSIDYKMLKVAPDMKRLEGIPRRFFIPPDVRPR